MSEYVAINPAREVCNTGSPQVARLNVFLDRYDLKRVSRVLKPLDDLLAQDFTSGAITLE
jgi:hypothetical protein